MKFHIFNIFGEHFSIIGTIIYRRLPTAYQLFADSITEINKVDNISKDLV